MKNSNSGLNIYPKASTKNLVVQPLKDETLIYNIKTNRAFCLNPTAAFVWNKSDGQTCVSEIAKQISSSEEIIWLALKRLQEENLIAFNDQVASHYIGTTRREIIKRLGGLASMVALPIVSSVIAPSAAQAQSGASGGACTDNCSILGAACSCASGIIACAPGMTLGGTLGIGVCTSAAAALGISVSAGVNSNVCLVSVACLP